MKRTLKSNKGFSLVELIVVVLIMAIIAVALAPQVMKWVGHSRTATDASTYDTLYEDVQLLLANEDIEAAAKANNAKITLKMTKTGTDITVASMGTTYTAAKVAEELAKISGSEYDTGTSKLKSVKRKDGGSDYEINVIGDGTTYKIEKTKAPDASNVKS